MTQPVPLEDARCYAGIGSRATPPEVLALMRTLAARLAARGWVLRTGGAPGADQAFLDAARDAGGAVELYLPWPGFEGFDDAALSRPTAEAFSLAARHHPRWSALGPGARALQARNSHQVLGVSLDRPCELVVCWTPDGSLDGAARSAGGTGQALRIATEFDVQVVNLALEEHRRQVERFVGRGP